ncbi:hypothetical protein D9M68_384350 [compost metagenome]
MFLRHLRNTMHAARIAASAHPLVMFITHQRKPGSPMPGEHDGFAAGGGDIANVFRSRVADSSVDLPNYPDIPDVQEPATSSSS